MPPYLAERILKEADENNDGAIDLEEWVAWVQMSEVHPAPHCSTTSFASQCLLVYGG